MERHLEPTPTPCRDFDFEFGSWHVDHQRLKDRLTGCTEWEEFTGTCDARPILNGNGNIEDNVIELPSGTYRAAALRGYDREKGTWAIWWLDGRSPNQLDVPVIGRFSDGIGAFYAEDTLRGMPIMVRFLWLDTGSPNPRWEQAFSADGGKTWETNWRMRFTRT
jgi:hypothetical protein